MIIDPADLSTLSRLLNEAMDLGAGEVDDWLARLSVEHQPLRPRLREMLANRNLSAGFLLDGPKLEHPACKEVARPGTLVGPYRLIREIGQGGMGSVWLAERADGGLKRRIALKLPRLVDDASLDERMESERDICALLEHPGIVRLYDAGADILGRPYLTLEYVDGLPLDAWCQQCALSVPQRLRLFLQVADAVAFAHDRFVLHGDLKPANVLVSADGRAHLLDFGIAKLMDPAVTANCVVARERTRALTPHFASPEQLRGDMTTIASDIYSLGVLLYELLTGNHPYAAECQTLPSLEQAILEGEPPPASRRAPDKITAKILTGGIDAILAKALRREPRARYATVQEMADDIDRYLTGGRVHARPDNFAPQLRRLLRCHRAAVATAVAMLIAALGGAGVGISITQAKPSFEVLATL